MPTTTPVPLAPFRTVAVLAAIALLLPFPGSLSVVVSRWALATTAPQPATGLLSAAAVAALAAGTATAVVRAWSRHRDRLPAVLGAALAVPLAYGASEALNALISQDRPCSRWAGAAHCPPAGDWSLPSNHATVAFAAVVVIAVAMRAAWATWLAGAVALAAAAGRVLEGVHYLHDVALGAVLGTVVAAAGGWCAVALRRRYGPGHRGA